MSEAPKPPGWLRRTWNKYALIVVGNIIFFALLYWFSYRPHNAESRSGEFLRLAQQQETDGRLEAAEALYRKVADDYGDTTAGNVARRRLPDVHRARAQASHLKAVEQQPPELELKKVIEGPPSWFLAKLLAGHHGQIADADRGRYYEVLDGYLRIAFERGEIDHKRLREEPAFTNEALRQRYVDMHASCAVESDWMYDDVHVRNDNLFPWTNAVIAVEVRQGERQVEDSLRLALLRPGERAATAEIRISADAGPVQCKVRVTTDEGELRFERRL